MTLPYDNARCIGRQVEAFPRQCEKRDTCLRYLDVVPGVDHWYDVPQIPGPCSAYLPRREAPPEQREGVPPSNPLPSTPGDLQ